MASFNIEWKKSTKKDLRKLPPKEVGRISRTVDALAENAFPHGVEKLTGSKRATATGWEIIGSFMRSSANYGW